MTDTGLLSVLLGRQLSAAVKGTQPDRAVAVGQIAGNTLLIDGVQVPALWANNLVPVSGTSCLCVRAGQRWVAVSSLVTTPSALLPQSGKLTVVTSGASTMTVQYTLSDGTTKTVVAPFLSGPTYAVGNTVALGWYSGYDTPMILGLLGTTPTPTTTTGGNTPPPPPPTPPKVVSGTTTIVAIDSGTWIDFGPAYEGYGYADGWNVQKHVSQLSMSDGMGQARYGYWWYGNASASKLSGLTISKVELYVPRADAGALGGMHLYTHSTSYRPASLPSLSAFGDIWIEPGRAAGWVTLGSGPTTAVVSSLRANGGIGIAGSPPMTFVGVGPSSSGYDPSSGALRFTWTKTV